MRLRYFNTVFGFGGFFQRRRRGHRAPTRRLQRGNPRGRWGTPVVLGVANAWPEHGAGHRGGDTSTFKPCPRRPEGGGARCALGALQNHQMCGPPCCRSRPRSRPSWRSTSVSFVRDTLGPPPPVGVRRQSTSKSSKARTTTPTRARRRVNRRLTLSGGSPTSRARRIRRKADLTEIMFGLALCVAQLGVMAGTAPRCVLMLQLATEVIDAVKADGVGRVTSSVPRAGQHRDPCLARQFATRGHQVGRPTLALGQPATTRKR